MKWYEIQYRGWVYKVKARSYRDALEIAIKRGLTRLN